VAGNAVTCKVLMFDKFGNPSKGHASSISEVFTYLDTSEFLVSISNGAETILEYVPDDMAYEFVFLPQKSGEVVVTVEHLQWSSITHQKSAMKTAIEVIPASPTVVDVVCGGVPVVLGNEAASNHLKLSAKCEEKGCFSICVVSLFDEYGNIARGGQEVNNAGVTVGSSNALEVTDMVENGQSGLSFTVSTVTGSTAAIMDVENGVSSKPVTISIGTQQVEFTVDIHPVVTLACADETTGGDIMTAGEPISCTIKVVDGNDRVVSVETDNVEVFTSGTAGEHGPLQKNSNNEITVVVKATVKGSAGIAAHYAMSGAQQVVEVVAAQYELTKTTLACDTACNVADTVDCILTTRDTWGNPTLSLRDAADWKVRSPDPVDGVFPLGLEGTVSAIQNTPEFVFKVGCNALGVHQIGVELDQLDVTQTVHVLPVGEIVASNTKVTCGYTYLLASSDVNCVITTVGIDNSPVTGAAPAEFSIAAVGEAAIVVGATAQSDGATFQVTFTTSTSGMAQCLSFFDVCRAGIKVEFRGSVFTTTVSVLGGASKDMKACPAPTLGLKSLSPGKQVDLTFLNHAGEAAYICWLDYDGSEVLVKTLMPQRFAKISAFDAHAFVVRTDECGAGKLLAELSHIAGAAPQLQEASAARTIVIRNCEASAA